jgi:hypothetical protein
MMAVTANAITKRFISVFSPAMTPRTRRADMIFFVVEIR